MPQVIVENKELRPETILVNESSKIQLNHGKNSVDEELWKQALKNKGVKQRVTNGRYCVSKA